MMPALTAATWWIMGSRITFPSASSLRQARARATKPPVTEAVRVPPSPCKTSQSTVIVRSPKASLSTAERRLRPMSR